MDVGKRAAEVASVVSAAAAIYFVINQTSGPTVTPVPHPATIQNNVPLILLGLTVVCSSILNFIALHRKPVTAERKETEAKEAAGVLPSPLKAEVEAGLLPWRTDGP